jgi:type IV pilus assembly protein PilM
VTRDWRSLLARLRGGWLDAEPPLQAFEVRQDAVAGVRLTRGVAGLGLGAAASLELGQGAILLSATEPNLKDADGFSRTLRVLADRLGIGGGAPVALVLPDAIARVAFVAPADVGQGSHAETEEVLRFRLKKSLPFDIQQTRLAWVELPPAVGRAGQVLVAAVFGPVLQRYEDAVRDAGFEPGLVELAGLSLASAVRSPAGADELLVNWEAGYVSLVLLRDGEPVLFRTIAGELAADAAEVGREAGNTVLYYRERLGGAGLARALLRSAALPVEQALAELSEPIGLVPEIVDAWGALPGAPDRALGQSFAAAAAVLTRTA